MTETIKKQILAVRDTCQANMFDVHAVQNIARHMGFHEAAEYLEDHNDEYVHFIIYGTAESEDG